MAPKGDKAPAKKTAKKVAEKRGKRKVQSKASWAGGGCGGGDLNVGAGCSERRGEGGPGQGGLPVS